MMMTVKLIMFLFLFCLATATAVYYKNVTINKTLLDKKYKEAKAYDKAVQDVVTARGIYLKVYSKYPTSIAELISKGYLYSNFETTEYGKDITLNSDGSITIANREIGNDLKNQLLVTNQDVSLSQKNIDNTIGLIEQKKRFNNIKNNEESIVLGTDISLTKNSSSFSEPSLKSSNTITNESTTNLKGW